MKESDFTNAANWRTIHIMQDALRFILPGFTSGISKREYKQMTRTLSKWNEAVGNKVQK